MDGAEEVEVLPLDLNALQACVLVVICSRVIPSYLDIKEIMVKELNRPIKDRADNVTDEELSDNLSELELVIETLKYVYKETSKIAIELDSGDDKPKFIQKPNFRGLNNE